MPQTNLSQRASSRNAPNLHVLATFALQKPTTTISDLTGKSPANVTIPGRTVQFITGKLSSTCEDVTAVLVEPSTKLPTHMCLACSSSPLTNGADVVLQVLNNSPTPITIYKGMKLATATPEQCVLLVSPAGISC